MARRTLDWLPGGCRVLSREMSGLEKAEHKGGCWTAGRITGGQGHQVARRVQGAKITHEGSGGIRQPGGSRVTRRMLNSEHRKREGKVDVKIMFY